eukprot:2146140-Pyramimonas_sp.AAC.1
MTRARASHWEHIPLVFYLPRGGLMKSAGRLGGGALDHAVAKRLGVPIGLPKSVLITFRGLHDMFLEQFWLGLSYFST